MNDYAKPIFRAAGVGSQNIRIHIVNDRNFNAFVVDGHNMFMHAGALMIADTPNQVIGVFDEKKSAFGGNFDHYVLIPVTTYLDTYGMIGRNGFSRSVNISNGF